MRLDSCTGSVRWARSRMTCPVHEDRNVSAQRRLIVEHVPARLRVPGKDVVQHFAHRAPGSLGFRAGDVALHVGREHDLGHPGNPFRTGPASARLAATRSLRGATDGVDSHTRDRELYAGQDATAPGADRRVMPLVYVMYAFLVVACAAILFPHRGGRVDRVGAGGETSWEKKRRTPRDGLTQQEVVSALD